MAMVSKYKCDDAGSTCSESSVDTNEALSEMLGLPPASLFDGLLSAATEEVEHLPDYGDCADDDVESATTATTAVTVVRDRSRQLESKSSPLEEMRASETTFPPPPPPPRVSSLDVPRRCSRHLHHPSDVAAFALHDFLDAAECRCLIRLASAPSSSVAGFRYIAEASHTDDRGATHVVKLREANRHKLSVFEHRPTVDSLWKRMEPAILPHVGSFVRDVGCGPPVGLNPRLRVLRYDADDDDVFDPHFDATTRADGRTSLLTVLIYLNDGGGRDFDGGETRFVDHSVSRSGGGGIGPRGRATEIAPEAGKAVLFEHDLFHSSAPLIFGTKYVLRTDVLFELDKRIDGGRGGGGIGGPRGGPGDREGGRRRGSPENGDAATPRRTVLDACRRLSLTEAAIRGLDEMGLLDLTLDSLLAPGVCAVREVLRDVLDEPSAESLIRAALEFPARNIVGES